MNKLISRLEKINALLEESKQRQKRIAISTYYTEFAGEEQRVKEIKIYQNIERRLLRYKHSILDSMRIKIALEQCGISERERELNTN